MPQLDLSRLFLDNLSWSLGFFAILLVFILTLYLTPIVEKVWFLKSKVKTLTAYLCWLKNARGK